MSLALAQRKVVAAAGVAVAATAQAIDARVASVAALDDFMRGSSRSRDDPQIACRRQREKP
jgi:hypothetical protein